MVGIYKITSPTGRIYIGESGDIEKRKASYIVLSGAQNQPKLLNSLLKYGFENHTFEVIEECLFDELLCRERYWQDFYDVLNGGLNCKLTQCGDLKVVHSKETRAKISKSNKGKKGLKGSDNPMFGKYGENNPLYGIPRPQEVKNSIRDKKLGVPNKAFENITEDRRKEIWSNAGFKTGNKSRPRLVIDMEMGIFYDCAKDASKALTINYNTLIDYLKGKYQNKTNLRWAE